MYFEERCNERKEEDPVKDKITFTHPWSITLPPPDENNVINFTSVRSSFRTKYKFFAATWCLSLERNRLTISYNFRYDAFQAPFRAWNGTCFCSYNLYSDTEKSILLYSSPRTEMINDQTFDDFNSHAGFMTKFDEALNGQLVKTMVVFVELVLPTKFFYRPFELPTSYLSKNLCDEYPKDLEKDFRFEFMKDGDYVIKCPDGSISAMRVLLNTSCTFLKNYFKKSDDPELVVEHSIDVIKPIIIYLQTCCFQLPDSYDMDYVQRLYKAYDFFEPERPNDDFQSCVHQALCNKFVVVEKHSFDSILQWLKIAHQHYFYELSDMVITVIADKFYYEWNQTFPPNARNDGNPIFRNIFSRGPDRFQRPNEVVGTFLKIENYMFYPLTTNVIFP